MRVEDLQQNAHELAKQKGWWDDIEDPMMRVPEAIALIHSEASEALECYRDGEMGYSEREDGKPEGFGVELADIIIRVCDLAGALGISLTPLIAKKHAFNATRPHRHGGKKA